MQEGKGRTIRNTKSLAMYLLLVPWVILSRQHPSCASLRFTAGSHGIGYGGCEAKSAETSSRHLELIISG